MDFELAQQMNAFINDNVESTTNMKKLCRQAISEGCVLLENDGVLPLKNKKIALFGRCQINTFYAGYGSGGDVKPGYKTSILQGLLDNNASINRELVDEYLNWTSNNVPDEGTWGNWPLCFEEMDINDELMISAANNSDVAVVVIGRSAGEDRDIKLEAGSWYLNEKEKKLLSKVRKSFDQMCVVINSGSIMDINELLNYKPNAILYIWQGGQETGNGLADVLLGNTSPSGKLTDTVALIEDYPSTNYFGNELYNEYVEDVYVGYRYFNSFAQDKIIYPFGYGLTYSKFSYDVIEINQKGCIIDLKINVKNIGNYKAKEVIELYLSKPNNCIGNPFVELVGYKKTKELMPNEEENLNIKIDISKIASYDENGGTGYKNCFVLEKGLYKLLIGFNSLEIENVYSFKIFNTVLIKKTKEACAPIESFKRMVNKDGIVFEDVTLKTINSRERIISYLPTNNNICDKYYTFDQVINNEITLDEFVETLDFDELEALTRGSLYAMNSPLGPAGNAGTLAGSTEKLFKRNIIAISTNDGPSGVRLSCNATLLPNGVLLASTFNDELVEEIGFELGKEVYARDSHILLAPGLNIHRSPLCGRNFEYYSEDPYLSGKIAAAYIRGVQMANVGACPKHFACNSQEYQRHVNDSRLSQRALREIYLRGFEICIKEAKPRVLMTSYNKINGEYTYYSHDLVRIILREELGYDGLVITDWWMRDDESKIFTDLKKQGYRIRASVDVYMPGSTGDKDNPGESDGTLLYSYNKGAITLAEIRYCAKNVLSFILNDKI